MFRQEMARQLKKTIRRYIKTEKTCSKNSTELVALETSDPSKQGPSNFSTSAIPRKISAAGASPRDPFGPNEDNEAQAPWCYIAGVVNIPAMSRGVGFLARFVDCTADG